MSAGCIVSITAVAFMTAFKRACDISIESAVISDFTFLRIADRVIGSDVKVNLFDRFFRFIGKSDLHIYAARGVDFTDVNFINFNYVSD